MEFKPGDKVCCISLGGIAKRFLETHSKNTVYTIDKVFEQWGRSYVLLSEHPGVTFFSSRFEKIGKVTNPIRRNTNLKG